MKTNESTSGEKSQSCFIVRGVISSALEDKVNASYFMYYYTQQEYGNITSVVSLFPIGISSCVCYEMGCELNFNL